MSERKTSYDSPGDAGALNFYLRQIGNFPTSTTLEMQQMCRDFWAETNRLRRCLCRFGLVVADRLRRMEAVANGDGNLNTIFLSSSLKDDSRRVIFSREDFDAYRMELEALYSRMCRDFAAGAPVETLREEIAELLDGHPFSIADDSCYPEVIANYFSILSPDYSLESCSVREQPDMISTDQIEFVENKILFRLGEMPAEMKMLAGIFRSHRRLRNRIAEANLRLVVSIAQRYRNLGLAFNDLIQEGNLGLLHAIDRFDFQLGFKISTYATWWIKHHIVSAIAAQSRVIRIPMHMIKSINKMRSLELEYLQTHGEEPDNSALAAMMNLPEARISAIRKMTRQAVSLQSSVAPDDDGLTLEELIPDTVSPQPDQETSRNFLRESMYRMLGSLSERDQQIIILRFGFFNQKCHSLEEVSKRLNLTRERVRQLEIKVMNLLRTPEKMRYFDNCYQEF